MRRFQVRRWVGAVITRIFPRWFGQRPRPIVVRRYGPGHRPVIPSFEVFDRIESPTSILRLDPVISSVLVSALRNHLRSEEHTSELQSHLNLVSRLLLEKK